MQKIGRFFTNFLLAVLVAIALVIVVPNVFGIQTRAVLSGSMEPAIPTGSMVFVMPEDAEDIELGDPITYILSSGTVVTHRVVEIDNVNRTFTVKGDANDTNDPTPVSWDNVLGVVRFQIPLLGYLLGFLLETQGKIIAITVIVALIILIFIFGGDDKKKDKDEKEEGDLTNIKKKKKQKYSRNTPYVSRYTEEGKGGDQNES